MKKLFRNIMLVALSAMMMFGMFATNAFADNTPGYKAYDPDKALAYAEAHWNKDKDQLCASYISRCVKAGGILFDKTTDKAGGRLKNGNYSGCWGLYKDLSARDFVTVSTLKANKNGKHLWSENKGKVAPGDVVFFHSTSDKSSNQYKHVVMVSGDKSGDTIKYYAHNNAKDGHSNLYAEKGKEMVVIHFKASYLEYCKEYNTHGTIRTTKQGNIKSLPCSVQTFAKSKSEGTLPAGTTLEAIGLIKNDQGNLWYKVLYKNKTLYWYAGDAKWVAWDSSDLAMSGAALPSGKIQAGKDYGLKGTVTAKYNKIESVSGEVYSGNACKGTAVITGSESGLSSKKYELKNSKVDKLLRFNDIHSCGKFNFVIKVTCGYSYAADGQKMVSRSEQCIVKTSSFTIG